MLMDSTPWYILYFGAWLSWLYSHSAKAYDNIIRVLERLFG